MIIQVFALNYGPEIHTMKNLIVSFFLIVALNSKAQIFSFTEKIDRKEIVHKILLDDQYLIHTVYEEDPAKFMMTRGGFYHREGDIFFIKLEFNSNFEKDSLREVTIEKRTDWKNVSLASLPLEGKWLMGGRVQEDGTQNRRDTGGPRKTMKFLFDGHFQWTAFHTETMRFSGCGGGTYTAQNGTYSESIEYFSRDNSIVSMTLDFQYDLQGDDWFHRGYSSKGNPMHEIWVKRKK